MLVNMVFGLSCLDLSQKNQIDHLELFAGQCSVSRAEYMDRLCQNKQISNDISNDTYDTYGMCSKHSVFFQFG